jgi:hypothetical protein
MLLFVVLVLLGCKPVDTVYSGRIDEDFRSRIQPAVTSGGPISISSGGGIPQVAYDIAQLIDQGDLAVEFPENCFSACSEFFIPASPMPRFSRNTLIGFHGSDFTSEILYRDHYRGNRTLCGEERLAWLHDVYRRRGLNPLFGAEVINRLGIRIYEFPIRSAGCVGSVISYVPALWIPTSEQLLKYWGLDTRGVICADAEECWRPRLIALGYRGDTVIVGDQTVLV